ncbi:aminoacyl-tRNA hydrolase [Aeromicrobium phragmitis]|uniref:Aminoacyl-tRNA hydrolase n=1 Tax=Aeromicrobium phragmitis TaxID=2478914 RepID=A0A3L8PN78_9ACTN|nr:alternative ribosome rescue aminoacyl-tRNA hydrolase ArfB [Aeromicrobium phragmitis]RLV56781.1 aminoacyl-tRNA hydrolase [Aeromicrobium phragmitis]
MSTRRHGRIRLPEEELSWRFSRSSGPGGQHVNTSDTRAEVRWSLASSTILDDDEKDRATQRLRSRLTSDGVLAVASSRYRSQHRNREAARVRLEELVTEAVAPVAKRKPTRKSRAADQRRLDAKRRRSDLKRSRRMQP